MRQCLSVLFRHIVAVSVVRSGKATLLSTITLTLCTFLSISAASAKPSDTLLEEVGNISESIASGRNVDAATRAVSLVKNTSGEDKQPAFWFAAWVCVAVYDVECAKQALEISNKLISETGEKLTSRLTYGYNLLLWSFVETQTYADSSRIRPAVGVRFPTGVISPMNDPVLYADLHILAARRAANEARHDDARLLLEKATASTLSLRNEEFNAARLIVRIAGALAASYDVDRALRLIVQAEPILTNIPPNSLLQVEYLEVRGMIAASVEQNSFAARDYEAALASLLKQQSNPTFFNFVQESLNNSLLGLRMLSGDSASIRQALDAHPLSRKKPEIVKRGYFSNVNEFYFSVAEELSLSVLGDGSASAWPDLWAKPATWTAVPDALASVEKLGQAALGISYVRSGKMAQASELLIDAGRSRLRYLQDLYGKSQFVAPLPMWTDRFLLQMALGVATRDSKAPDFDFILSAHSLLTRNLQSSADDVLAMQAVQATDEKRRAVQTYQAIEHQRTTWQGEMLSILYKRHGSSAKLDEKEQRGERLAILDAGNDFLRTRLDLSAAITGGEGSTNVTAVTKLLTVQKLLRRDEAAILHLGVVGDVVKVCITRDSATMVRENLAPSFAADASLLQSALAAQHLPSVKSDSEFPVAQAIRMKDLLFRGLDDCMSGRSRIYIIGVDPALAGIPPAALLEEVPPTTENGYDLRRARWLVKKFAFVRVSSLGVFAASRKLGSKRKGTLDYLGIGDPKLTKLEQNASGGRERAATALGAFGPTKLPDLEQLPEGAEEVEKVASLFPQALTRVLLKEQATEEAFRLQPLSEFDVIHFATHGLMREEVAGLNESALLLSAGAENDAFGDGLLTTTQIGALPLRARLVILSACNSGRFDLQIATRGIQGLSTAFTLAGVPSVVASLWPVDSQIARDTIVQLFKALKSPTPMPVADALADATRALLATDLPTPFYHPRFWAALIAIGDGGIALEPEPAGVRLVGPYTPVDSAGGGEFLSGIPFGKDFIASGLGPWNGEKFPSVIERRTPSGEVVWSVVDQDFHSPRVASIEDEVYAGGYVLPNKEGGATPQAEVRRLNGSGKVIWERRLNAPGLNRELVVDIQAVGGDRIGVLARTTLRQSGEQSIRYVELNREGAAVREIDNVADEKAGTWLTGRIGTSASTLLLSMNRDHQLAESSAFRVNLLGQSEACWVGDAAFLALFDKGTFGLGRKASIPRFRVTQVLLVDDVWILVGRRRDECRLEGKAAVYFMKKDAQPVLMWQDELPFDSEIRAARVQGESLEIMGVTKRAVSVQSFDQTVVPSDPDYKKQLATARLGDEERTATELFAVRLGWDGLERARDFLGAGLPIWPNGAAYTSAEEFVVYGSVGTRPFWMLRQ